VAAVLAIVGTVGVIFGIRAAVAARAAEPVPVAPSRTGIVGRSLPVAFASGPSESPAPTFRLVTVHVVGEVTDPGVVQVPDGSRVADVVLAAGGALASADLERINLARLVADGEQVHVPAPGEQVLAGSNGSVGGPPGAAIGGTAAPVNLNTADLTLLDSLPGVGPVLAQRILDWRAEHGRFTSIDELGEVSGIGDKLLSQLTPKVTV